MSRDTFAFIVGVSVWFVISIGMSFAMRGFVDEHSRFPLAIVSTIIGFTVGKCVSEVIRG